MSKSAFNLTRQAALDALLRLVLTVHQPQWPVMCIWNAASLQPFPIDNPQSLSVVGADDADKGYISSQLMHGKRRRSNSGSVKGTFRFLPVDL